MAPRADLITPLGLELIEDLPPILQEDPDYRAVLHCMAKESARLEESIENVRAQFFPRTATDFGLRAWEQLLKLPSAGTVEQRREAVRNRYKALRSDPSGAAWLLTMDRRLNNAAWSYEEAFIATGENLVANPRLGVDAAGWAFFGTAQQVAERAAMPFTTEDYAFHVVAADNGIRATAGAEVRMPLALPNGAVVSFAAEVYYQDSFGMERFVFAEVHCLDASGDTVAGQVRVPVETGVTARGRLRVAIDGVVLRAHGNGIRLCAGLDTGALTMSDKPATAEAYVTRFILSESARALAYGDGSTPSWRWNGTPHASSSEQMSVAPQTLRIFLPFPAGSAEWNAALKAFDEESPAELALIFVSSTGFLLDISQMDVEGLGV